MSGSPSTGVGATVARYVVLEEIGRGGMGRVCRAYDPKLQREVALKEVHPDALGTAGADRIVVEARAMAKLSHPNVVAVYDVDELERGVVLVMEYVAGSTLHDWLAERPRTWREIVDRFCAAGRGLAAAHAVGVLHRDFKPRNVVVGDDGSVKVTDFYMPPEQHFGEPLTHAADQYAFCVSLWEALCGQAPFVGDDLPRRKLEGPPPWPDGSAPPFVGAAIRRGLAERPGDRWPSMDALTEALATDPTVGRRRWIIGIAVVGVAVVVAEGARSWWARRTERCSGAAERLAGTWDAARKEEIGAAVVATNVAYAPPVWEHTASELDRYAGEWIAQHVEACEATTVRGEQSEAVMDLRMACLERARVELDAVSRVIAEPDEEVIANLHALTAGLRPVANCAEIQALSGDVEPPAPEEAPAVEEVRKLLAEAQARLRAGHYADARAKDEEARRRVKAIAYGPVHAEQRVGEGMTLVRVGDYPAAEETLRAALEIAIRTHQWREAQVSASQLEFVVGAKLGRPDEGLRYREIAMGLARSPMAKADVHSATATIFRVQAKFAEAEAEHRRALAVALEAFGGDDLAPLHANLGVALAGLGRHSEAEAEFREALRLETATLGPNHPEAAVSMGNVAAALNSQGKHREAEAMLHRAVAALEASLGADHPHLASTLTSLGIAQHDMGEFTDAVESYRRAIAISSRALGEEHPGTAGIRNNLANSLLAMGKVEEAESEHRKVLAVRTKVLGPEHPEVGTSKHNLGLLLRGQGRLAESEALLREALALREKALGLEHPEVALTRYALGSVLLDRRQLEAAEAELRSAMTTTTAVLGTDHPRVALVGSALADVLRERGAVEEALALAEQAWVQRAAADIAPAERAYTAFLLARLLSDRNADAEQRARARELAQRSLEDYRSAGESHASDVAEVTAWLEGR